MKKLSLVTKRRESRLLTLREVSEEFNLPLGTLRLWASQRKFPLYKIRGAKIRVDRDEFQEWLKEFHVKPLEVK